MAFSTSCPALSSLKHSIFHLQLAIKGLTWGVNRTVCWQRGESGHEVASFESRILSWYFPPPLTTKWRWKASLGASRRFVDKYLWCALAKSPPVCPHEADLTHTRSNQHLRNPSLSVSVFAHPYYIRIAPLCLLCSRVMQLIFSKLIWRDCLQPVLWREGISINNCAVYRWTGGA